MSKKLYACLAFVLALAIAFCAGCGADSVEEQSNGSDTQTEEQTATSELQEVQEGKTITDMVGREVTLEKEVEKVVALTPSDVEIIYALGAEDLLVARGPFVDYPEEAMELPEVASGEDINIEQIINYEPDVVTLSAMNHTDEQVKTLEDAGLTVVVFDAKDLEGVYESIELHGQILNKEKEAEELVNEMKSTFEEYTELAKDKEGGTIYFEVGPLEYGLWAAGSGTFMDEIGTMLGLENIFAEDVQDFGEISEEQVLSKNPDHIVTIAMYEGQGPTPEEEILGRDGWENVSAIQKENVYSVDANTFSRPSPRLMDGIEDLYNKVYGEE